MSLEFELTPGQPTIRTNRECAIISLHVDATNYLTTLDSKVRPIDLTILKRGYYDGVFNKYYYYAPSYSDWKDRIRDFSTQFMHRYPDVEQVYAFSQFSANREPDILTCGEVISPQISEALNNVILKRLLLLPCTGEVSGQFRCYEQPSSSSLIQKTIERSLRFSSW